MRGVEIPSDKDAVRIHVLSATEESLYFEAATRYPALHHLGRLMINQGCRPEEILALQVGDVDLERSRLAIRIGTSSGPPAIAAHIGESRDLRPQSDGIALALDVRRVTPRHASRRCA